MNIIEMFIDENEDESGINAISVVENPAIESNFLTRSKEVAQLNLKEVNKEKRILMGAALIPNKTILRVQNNQEYYIYFSKETVRQGSELFLKRGNQAESTLEHDSKLTGLTVVESWIVEDKEKDKTALHGIDVPVGTWMVSIKVDNPEVYNFAKQGVVKGFSIEGYFADKAIEQAKLSKNDDFINKIKNILHGNDESI